MMAGLWRRLRRWPLSALFVLGLAVFALFAALMGNASIIANLGRPAPGVQVGWSATDQCYVVEPDTPVTWPGLAEVGLRPGDCLLSVDGIDFIDQESVNAHFQALMGQTSDPQRVQMTVDRDGYRFTVTAPLIRLSLFWWAQAQLALLAAGLCMWLVGLLVLLAQPQTRSNRVMAATMIIAAILVLGAGDDITNESLRRQYGFVFIFGPRPVFGLLLMELALVWPTALHQRALRIIRPVMYGLAVVIVAMYGIELLSSRQDWDGIRAVARVSRALTAFLWSVGGAILLVRIAAIWRDARNPRAASQARLLLLAFLLALPLILADLVIHHLVSRWFLPATSNITFVLWLIPSSALVAYTMLRYQTFAYRGTALVFLVVLFASVTLTQVYGLFTMPRTWNGVQFIAIWGAVLLATIFWQVDTPLRRGFRRIFSRHENDYLITQRFSLVMATAATLEETMAAAARTICLELEVAWVGLVTDFRPSILWLARANQADSERIIANDRSLEDFLPEGVDFTHPIGDGRRAVGRLWLGERLTAEPLDESDEQLIALLAQELTRSLAVQAQIEDLASVSGRILEAVDDDRRRIGRELHDSVLQFLGAMPLDLARARDALRQDPQKSARILDRIVEQSEIIATETRAMVYDLRPPLIAQGELVTQMRGYAQRVCHDHSVTLKWSAQGRDWQSLPSGDALHVYRIMQQAVNNALQHSNPTTIEINLVQVDRMMKLDVKDDGSGLEQEYPGGQGDGLGLLSMRERARALRGSIRLVSSPGRGTSVILTFDLRG